MRKQITCPRCGCQAIYRESTNEVWIPNYDESGGLETVEPTMVTTKEVDCPSCIEELKRSIVDELIDIDVHDQQQLEIYEAELADKLAQEEDDDLPF